MAKFGIETATLQFVYKYTTDSAIQVTIRDQYQFLKPIIITEKLS